MCMSKCKSRSISRSRSKKRAKKKKKERQERDENLIHSPGSKREGKLPPAGFRMYILAVNLNACYSQAIGMEEPQCLVQWRKGEAEGLDLTPITIPGQTVALRTSNTVCLCLEWNTYVEVLVNRSASVNN